MYRAFNYKDDLSLFNKQKYISKGEELFAIQKEKIEKNLKEFYLNETTLDGSELKNNWFPDVDCQVFLSHSHKDNEEIMGLAGFLSEEYKIKSFIDSNVWGYANDLLREIDNEYCYDEDRKHYIYESRNFSTAHVHMMLNTALMEMLDKCECIIFINTINTIGDVENTIKTGTYSPWIYSELNMIKHLRTRTPEREVFVKHRFEKKAEFKVLTILHDVHSALKSLDALTNEDFINLKSQTDDLREAFSETHLAERMLDKMYAKVPARNSSEALEK